MIKTNEKAVPWNPQKCIPSLSTYQNISPTSSLNYTKDLSNYPIPLGLYNNKSHGLSLVWAGTDQIIAFQLHCRWSRDKSNPGVSKLWPASRIRPAKVSKPARGALPEDINMGRKTVNDSGKYTPFSRFNHASQWFQSLKCRVKLHSSVKG